MNLIEYKNGDIKLYDNNKTKKEVCVVRVVPEFRDIICDDNYTSTTNESFGLAETIQSKAPYILVVWDYPTHITIGAKISNPNQTSQYSIVPIIEDRPRKNKPPVTVTLCRSTKENGKIIGHEEIIHANSLLELATKMERYNKVGTYKVLIKQELYQIKESNSFKGVWFYTRVWDFTSNVRVNSSNHAILHTPRDHDFWYLDINPNRSL